MIASKDGINKVQSYRVEYRGQCLYDELETTNIIEYLMIGHEKKSESASELAFLLISCHPPPLYYCTVL